MDTHYKLTIRLMKTLGLWPYVNETFRRVQSIVWNLISTILITAQIAYLTNDEIDATILLQSVCFLMITMGAALKFNTYMALIGTTRIIMDDIKRMWNTTHEGTLKILVKRAILGKQQGAIYAIFIYPSAMLLVVVRVLSYAFIVTASSDANITDPFPVLTNYLIDEEKYFFFIMIHQVFMTFFVATSYVATETLYIMWLQHSISLFELASYHIEKGLSEKPPNISQEVMEVYRKKCLATAVKYHNEAKAFLTYLKRKFTFSYAMLIVLGVISLAINFFRLSTALSVTHNVEEMLLASFLSISELTYMFYVNYVLQKVVDYAADIPYIIYSTSWYNTSVPIQKTLLIIMLRCSEPLVFEYYGFYNASVEGFAGVCN